MGQEVATYTLLQSTIWVRRLQLTLCYNVVYGSGGCNLHIDTKYYVDQEVATLTLTQRSLWVRRLQLTLVTKKFMGQEVATYTLLHSSKWIWMLQLTISYKKYMTVAEGCNLNFIRK